VGIDRPDEDDAPDVEHDSPAAEGDSPAVENDAPATAEPDASIDSGADRMAYHLEYRATVEAVYQAVREAWTEAVPALRQAWAAHEEKYPERAVASARDNPDGSWRGGGQELNPAQNAEATQECAEIREQGKADILPAMRRIEEADSERHLIGLEHWLKGEDRLKEKVADRLRYQPELTARQALAEVPDAVRFTLAYSETRYAEGVRTDVERLKAEGFELIKLKNSWTSDQYKGINSQWRRPESGLRFEVQFHTPASFEAKQLTHKAYERIRSPLTSKDEEAELVSYQRRVNALVPRPPGAADIEDYPPENSDG
jgi:hypothetical protein